MTTYHIIVEKKPEFDTDTKRILDDIQVRYPKVKKLSSFLMYEISGVSKKFLDKYLYSVFCDITTDNVYKDTSIIKQCFGIEYLPGQFDQKADSAIQALKLCGCQTDPTIKTSRWIKVQEVTAIELKGIKQILINKVDCRERKVSSSSQEKKQAKKKEVKKYEGFLTLDNNQLETLSSKLGLTMDMEDIKFVQQYFKSEKRDPTETEIKVIDTYWSDHCRHTTFLTQITDVSFIGKQAIQIKKVYRQYQKLKERLSQKSKKATTLMDIATIYGKYLTKKKIAKDVFVSKENNAATIKVKSSNKEDWLVMFKNETHNHPTEIEPFGGAATCIGGAIRDPLSGRSYVYQAMRVTGAGNILEKWENTIKGKLPQRTITKEASRGYSSYGNQIGLATSHVSEIYHEGYKAKRMEVGFVIGATKAKNIIQKDPKPNDIILLLGGKTGRDGIGGATGSSKTHSKTSVHTLQAEIQKGNAPEERKIQRLFRKKMITKVIKKCNDFGAGGVCVAIGELADGVEVNLNLIPTKYKGLNGTEIATSESQERMAIVIDKKHLIFFQQECLKENIECTTVGRVTKKKHLVLNWENKSIVNLKRFFLSSNGAKKTIHIHCNEHFEAKKWRKPFSKTAFLTQLKSLNVSSKKGLIEQFDSTVGKTTVLFPYGGRYQLTPQDVSVHTLPTGHSNETTCTISSYGFDPFVSEQSPFYGSQVAVVESLSKIVATGGHYKKARLSFQEYFEKLGKDPAKWGKPFSALLGALKAQQAFQTPAIGGKDSMSGTFENLSVPPTLISFAVCPQSINNIYSSELKSQKSHIYFFEPETDGNSFNFKHLKQGYSFIQKYQKKRKILSAKVVGKKGLLSTIAEMCFGNKIGVCLTNNYQDVLSPKYGGIIFETKVKIKNEKFFTLIGHTLEEEKLMLSIGNQKHQWSLSQLVSIWSKPLETIFPTTKAVQGIYKEIASNGPYHSIKCYKSFGKPRVLIPVFPGTNCEYDTEDSFQREHAIVKPFVFNNINHNTIDTSIKAFVKELKKTQIVCFPGGFSAGDEPDGAGKYIVAFLKNEFVSEAIHSNLEKDFLILGICNGFQALIKSGLLPFGKISQRSSTSPTLTHNVLGKHISQIVTIKVINDHSPWLRGMKNKTFTIPVSHGEGRFYCNKETLADLVNKGQVATQYVHSEDLQATLKPPHNPNGSVYAIEGITNENGKVYGRMGHTERFRKGLLQNVPHISYHNIFKNGVRFFR